MSRPDPLRVSEVNWTQYQTGQAQGHYESFYLRGNHPRRPLAFWLRYTIFSPDGRPDLALGELWAVVFDGETGEHTTAKVEVPLAECVFSTSSFDVRVAGAVLDGAGLRGRAGEIGWDLRYGGSEPPLYLLPARLYHGGFPKAKSLVSLPLARFSGELTVAGRTIVVDGWNGSQNHNWGSRHTDRYAFGQVAGFDNAPESFLEVATARNRIGPLWTPAVTPLVLRHRGREHALTALRTGIRARATVGATAWTFASESAAVRIAGRIDAPAGAFVLLEYANPPGGVKYCLNTKLAACELAVTDRATGEHEVLRSAHGALYEVLDDVDPRQRYRAQGAQPARRRAQ
jgi:hypothetical protein